MKKVIFAIALFLYNKLSFLPKEYQ